MHLPGTFFSHSGNNKRKNVCNFSIVVLNLSKLEKNPTQIKPNQNQNPNQGLELIQLPEFYMVAIQTVGLACLVE